MVKTEMVHDPKRLFELLYSDEFEVCDARLVNDDMMEVQFRNMKDFEEQNNKVNVVIAAFTTAVVLYPQNGDVLETRVDPTH